MTAKKISELLTAPSITGAEILPAALAGNNYKISIDQIKGYVQVATASTSSSGLLSATDKQKLDGIPVGATKNESDAYLLNRANHTGGIPAATVSGLATVATSGSYEDLINKPIVVSVADHQGKGGVETHPIVTESQAGFMSPYHLGALQAILDSSKGKLDDLLNVKVGNPDGTGTNPLNNGQVLTYDTMQSAWINADSAGGLSNFSLADGTITDVSIGDPQTGQYLVFSSGYWQNTNPPSASASSAGFMSSAQFTKVNSLKTVATSGDYADLTGKPTFPTKLSDMTDCTIGSTTTGYVLTWSGTKWVPQAPTGGGGGSIAVKSQNSEITTAATTINFIGAGVSATAASGVVTVTVPGAGSTNPVTVGSTPPSNPSLNDIWLKV